MVAKLIIHGPTREAAIERMQVALSEMIIDGIRTNIPLQRRIMQDRVFRAGQHHIHYLEEMLAEWE
jgi:acetyl-CoA carboxylase biotin carboxylase subunit